MSRKFHDNLGNAARTGKTLPRSPKVYAGIGTRPQLLLQRGCKVGSHSSRVTGARCASYGTSANLTASFTGKKTATNVDLIHRLQKKPTQELAVRTAYAMAMRNMWILYARGRFLGIVAGCTVRWKWYRNTRRNMEVDDGGRG